MSLLNHKQQEIRQELQFYSSQLKEKELCIQACNKALERTKREMVALADRICRTRAVLSAVKWYNGIHEALVTMQGACCAVASEEWMERA